MAKLIGNLRITAKPAAEGVKAHFELVFLPYAGRLNTRPAQASNYDELVSLLNLGQTRPPAINDLPQVRSWVQWMSQSGARITVIDRSGQVLADSVQDPETIGDLSDRPEVQQAFASGQGQSLRLSSGLEHQMLYQAVR